MLAPMGTEQTQPARESGTRRSGLAWIMAGWLLLALAFIPQFYLLGRQPDIGAAVFRAGSIFGLWALFTPAVAWLVEKYPARAPSTVRNGVRLALAGVVAVALHALLAQASALLWVPAMRELSLLRIWRDGLLGLAATDVVFYVALLAALHVQQATRRLAAREQALAEARLLALRGQLQPHFLFNALNALSELAYRDPARTDRLITRLAELLRASLQGTHAHEYTLAQEIGFVRGYLEIEQALLGDRLQVAIHAPSSLDEARVPVLMLQPVVENAVRHGIAPMRRTGRLQIDVSAHDGRLSVRVHDDGLGRQAPEGGGAGIGLDNLRARLHALYGDAALLHIAYPPDGGCAVSIGLPLRLP